MGAGVRIRSLQHARIRRHAAIRLGCAWRWLPSLRCYRLFPLHLYGTMAVAGVIAVTSAVQLGRFAVRAGGLKLTVPPTVTPGRALTAAAPAL